MTNAAILGIGLLLLGVGFSRSRGGAVGEDSAREDVGEVRPGGGKMGRASVLLAALGWLYTWGGGVGVTTWAQAQAFAAKGLGVVDCSLFASLALVAMGIRKTFKRYTAAGLAEVCKPVRWGEQVPGDLVYYPGHVMVVLTFPDANGDSQVIGASGGGRNTHGDDPKARVKVMPSAKYRGDFVTFMRYPPEG